MNNDYTQQIEEYLTGQMDGKALSAFEEQMSNDPALADEVTLMKDVIGGVQEFNNHQLKGRLEKLHQKIDIEEKPETKVRDLGSRNWIRLLSRAAAVLLLIVAAYYLFSPNGPNREELLAGTIVLPDTEYAKMLVRQNTSSGIADPTKGKKDTTVMIAQFFQSGDYDAFLELIPEYQQRYGDSPEINYLHGFVLFQQKKYMYATRAFSPLIKDKSSKKHSDILWMSALSYMNLNTPAGDDAASILFKQLLENPGQYDTAKIQQFLDVL